MTLDEHRDWLWGLLARRPCTRQEAVNRLLKRGLDEEDAEALLKEALNAGLLDDGNYARLFAEGHEGWGNDRIAYELGRRGVASEDARAALEEIDEEARARELVAAWGRQGLETRKMIARLYRRGFTGKTIRRVEFDALNR